MNRFKLADEDSVSVDSVIPRYENMVEIKGAYSDLVCMK